MCACVCMYMYVVWNKGLYERSYTGLAIYIYIYSIIMIVHDFKNLFFSLTKYNMMSDFNEIEK